MTQDKLLDKLAKIKRLMESEKAIGNEAAAQTFADKLQAMLLEHDFQMTDLEFEKLEQEQPITEGWLDFNKHGVKTKKTRVAWIERLSGIIARANFCRILVSPGSSNIVLVGRAEHRAVAEYMIVTLVRALDSIATKEYGNYYRECIRRDGNPYAARGFRESFITGFVYRLFERLEERKRTAGTSTSTALVRLNREDRAVEQAIELRKKLPAGEAGRIGTSRGLALSRGSNYEGAKRGVKAANNINLDGRAVGGNSTTRKELA